MIFKNSQKMIITTLLVLGIGAPAALTAAAANVSVKSKKPGFLARWYSCCCEEKTKQQTHTSVLVPVTRKQPVVLVKPNQQEPNNEMPIFDLDLRQFAYYNPKLNKTTPARTIHADQITDLEQPASRGNSPIILPLEPNVDA